MLPEKTDPRWQNLVEGKTEVEFKFMAASLCLSRIQRSYRMNPDPETLRLGIEDLRAFFSKYEKNIQNELKSIFG